MTWYVDHVGASSLIPNNLLKSCFWSYSDPEQQLERLMKRNAMSEKLAKKRIEAQMPLEEKCALAHFVIDNSGSIENTREQALRLVNLLKSSWHHWKIRGVILLMFLAVFVPLIYLYLKF